MGFTTQETSSAIERCEGGHCYVKMPSEPPSPGAAAAAEAVRIFDELPKVTIVAVSWPEASDITPMLLSNTIEFKCKQDHILLYNMRSSWKPWYPGEQRRASYLFPEKVNYALGALYYLCSPSSRRDILKPEVISLISQYAAVEAVNVSFSNLAKAFLDKHVSEANRSEEGELASGIAEVVKYGSSEMQQSLSGKKRICRLY